MKQIRRLRHVHAGVDVVLLHVLDDIVDEPLDVEAVFDVQRQRDRISSPCAIADVAFKRTCQCGNERCGDGKRAPDSTLLLLGVLPSQSDFAAEGQVARSLRQGHARGSDTVGASLLEGLVSYR
jgi:hypothetical protein